MRVESRVIGSRVICRVDLLVKLEVMLRHAVIENKTIVGNRVILEVWLLTSSSSWPGGG